MAGAQPLPDHYRVLGIERGAAAGEVRAAYLRAARRHHPDRVQVADAGARRTAEEQMRAVNEAWAVLGDPARRTAYDLQLARDEPEPPRWRPDGGANPAFVPWSDQDVRRPHRRPEHLADDWFDDPTGAPAGTSAGTSAGDAVDDDGRRPHLPGAMVLVPPALGLAAFGAIVLGVVTALGELVSIGLVLAALAVVGFLALPLVAAGLGGRRNRFR